MCYSDNELVLRLLDWRSCCALRIKCKQLHHYCGCMVNGGNAMTAILILLYPQKTSGPATEQLFSQEGKLELDKLLRVHFYSRVGCN